ncbi:MAG: sigma-70 family RNA polymerase sigma factor, partial [Planctomycetes bacterium]|nr:sigma-70 family RNA polymerase sigma factor [Planctomycetota bacterium]
MTRKDLPSGKRPLDPALDARAEAVYRLLESRLLPRLRQHLRGRLDARDVLSRTVQRVLPHAEAFPEAAQLLPYAFVVARNVCRTLLRRAKSSGKTLETLEGSYEDKALENPECAEWLASLLDSLSPGDRELFHLTY